MRHLLCLLLLLVAAIGWGADYYVDADASDNSGAGTSGDPWRECPGMLDWDGSGTIAAGDTVYFDSSDTWTYSGETADEVLKLTPGVSFIGDTWGGGTRAKIDISSSTIYVGIVGWEADDAVNESLFQGFELDGNAGFSDDCTGVYVGWHDQTANMTGATKTIKNCVIHDIGNSGHSTYSYGILLSPRNNYDLSDVEILNCTIYNTDSDLIALYVSPDQGTSLSDVLVRGCESHSGGLRGTSWGSCVLVKNDASNVVIEFCYAHDSNQGITVETTDSGETAPSGVVVRYNVVESITNASGLYVHGDFTGARDATFYGNIVHSGSEYGIFIAAASAGTSSTTKVYNNTFYNNTDYELAVQNSSITNTVEVKNNIFSAGAGTLPLYDVGGNEITAHNNNLYYRSGGGNVVTNGGSSYTAATVTDYEGTAQSSDPNFKNTSNLPTGFSGTYGTDMEPDNDGLSIESGDALGNGADLGDTYRGAINLSGKSGGLSRDSAAAWDMGAYQYGTSPAAASSNLIVVLAMVFDRLPSLLGSLLRTYAGYVFVTVGGLAALALALKVINRI
jgi:hypothetical protein